MKSDDRQRRIDAARQSREILNSFDLVKNQDHRTAVVHDRVVEAIDDICQKHNGSTNVCFTPAQIECLKELSFHIAYILDPKNKAADTIWGRLKQEYTNSPAIAKIAFWAVLVSVVSGMFQIVDLGVKGYTWASEAYLSKPTQPSSTNPAADAKPQPKINQTVPAAPVRGNGSK